MCAEEGFCYSEGAHEVETVDDGKLLGIAALCASLGTAADIRDTLCTYESAPLQDVQVV